MNRLLIVAVSASLMASAAYADFGSWSVEASKDPFSGGEKIEVSYFNSLRSGVFALCDSSQSGVEVRVIAGWEYVSDLEGYEAVGGFAFDGNVVASATGEAGAFGQNIAGVSFRLEEAKARLFAEGMERARSQVAIKDGISKEPHLLSASGSTKAGKALLRCLNEQASRAGEARVTDPSKLDQDDPGVLFAKFMGMALAVEDKCEKFYIKTDATNGNHLSQKSFQLAQDLILPEKEKAIKTIASMSCSSAAAAVMEFTDLPYDSVWKE